MKTIRILALLALVVILFSSCKKEERRVRQAATAYLEATSAYDIDRARQYCTPEASAGLCIIKEHILPQLPPDYIQQYSQAEVKITGIEIVNDTLAKVAWWKKTPTDTYSDTLKMVNRDGQWLADVHFVIPQELLQE